MKGTCSLIIVVTICTWFRFVFTAVEYSTHTSLSHHIVTNRKSLFNFTCIFNLKSSNNDKSDFTKVFMKICYKHNVSELSCHEFGESLSLVRIFDNRKNFTSLIDYAKRRIKSGIIGEFDIYIYYEQTAAGHGSYNNKFFFSFTTDTEFFYSGIYFCEISDTMGQIASSEKARSNITFNFPDIYLKLVSDQEEYYSTDDKIIASCSTQFDQNYSLEVSVDIDNRNVSLLTRTKTKEELKFLGRDISVERSTFAFSPKSQKHKFGKRNSLITIKCFKSKKVYSIAKLYFPLFITPYHPTLKFKPPTQNKWTDIPLSHNHMRQYPFRLFHDGQFADQVFFELYERQAVPLGSKFKCEYEGQPRPNVTWRRLLGPTQLEVEETEGKSTLSLTLSRHYFQRKDAIFTMEFIYQCRATQTIGKKRGKDSFNIIFITRVPLPNYLLNDSYIFDWIEVQIMFTFVGILLLMGVRKFLTNKFEKYNIMTPQLEVMQESAKDGESNNT